MKHCTLSFVAAASIATAVVIAQGPTPFKLGTFERQGAAFLGVVVRETFVIDLAAANAAIANPTSSVAAPVDMKDLIARYDSGIRARIVEIVNGVGDPTRGSRPSFVHELNTVKTLPPIVYPTVMLNVAVNYRAHAVEMAGRLGDAPPPKGSAPGTALPGTRSAPGIWERAADDPRWNPYMFLKSPTAVIADGEPIRIPTGRDQIDWECELGIVIGRRASQVPAAHANDYIFGYTLENDVSDRGGRGDTRHGSDWLIAKSHDTFAPLGPFIVPKEFVRDPQRLGVTFTLSGKVMQEASTSLMIHTVPELVSYASNILTLGPGDVIATGSPAGVGAARTPPIFLKPGDVSVCTYDGIGTLTNPVF